jgi:hypothetical protein
VEALPGHKSLAWHGAQFKRAPRHLHGVGEFLSNALKGRLGEIAEWTDVIAQTSMRTTLITRTLGRSSNGNEKLL